MTVKDFTNHTIGTQLVGLEDTKRREIIFLGTVEKLEQNNELLKREIYFFTAYDFQNRILIRIK